MLFRQLFDYESWTYTYLLADMEIRKAVLIDPVLDQMPLYRQLLQEFSLSLAYAVDTHVHADHITALGALRQEFGCLSVHGMGSQASCVSKFVEDGEILEIGELQLKAVATPGHTEESFCFLLERRPKTLLFTGDTLLIRGTGRTDFQNGDAGKQFDSIWQKILTMPDDVVVYPGHDYRGMTQTTVGEERLHNPRLKVTSREAYIELMNGLDLPNPKFMDVAVPANLSCGEKNMTET